MCDKLFMLKRSKLFWTFIYLMGVILTFTFLSIKTYSSDVNKKGAIDSITQVDINHEEYNVENTTVINREVLGKEVADKVSKAYSSAGFYSTLSENPKYFKVVSIKVIPYKTLIKSTEAFPFSSMVINTNGGIVNMEGIMDIKAFNIPNDVRRKFGDRINITVKVQPSTKLLDSTGIIHENISTYHYTGGDTSFMKLAFKEPFMYNIPFFKVKTMGQFFIFLIIVFIILFMGYLIIAKSLGMYDRHKEKEYNLRDVSYGYSATEQTKATFTTFENSNGSFGDFQQQAKQNFNFNSFQKQNEGNPLNNRFYQ